MYLLIGNISHVSNVPCSFILYKQNYVHLYIFETLILKHFRPLPLLHLSTVGKKHRFCNLVETSFQRVYQGQFQSRRIAERAVA